MFWRPLLYEANGFTDDSDISDLVRVTSLNQASIHNGDNVERLLVSYSFSTQIEDNSSSLQNPPEPWMLGVSYTPNPDGSPDFDSSTVELMAQGDSLYFTTLRWKPYHWTDGTLHGTQWRAESLGVESVQGRRKIEDKTTAQLNYGIQPYKVLIDDFTAIPVSVTGHLHVKYLIKPLFG